MTLSAFGILMLLLIGLVAFVHMLQGFFSATISAILAIFAAVVALSYHETIVEKYLGGKMADSAHAMVLVVLFAVIYLVLRTIFDRLVPGNIRLPAAADKAGGAIMGIVAGIFGIGVLAVAAQEMSFFPAISGYSRYVVADSQGTVLNHLHNLDRTSYDQMVSPTFVAGDRQKMLLPIDDMLVGLTERLSDRGSLYDGEPLARIHPDWLTELFGQRLGMEPGAKRVLLDLPGKGAEAYADALYDIPAASRPDGIPWIDAEFPTVRGSSKPNVTKNHLQVKPADELVVVRVRFSKDAAGRTGGSLIRISPGSVRLVTAGSPDAPESGAWVDNYPIGTMQYFDNDKKRLPYPVVVGQNVDDFLFLPDTTVGEGDPGIDFVFELNRAALGWGGAPINEATLAKGDVKMPNGAFIEIKRLVRQDLGGMKVQPETALLDKNGAITPLRHEEEMTAGYKALKIKESDKTAPGAPPGTAAPTPKPTPVQPAAPAGPKVTTLDLDVASPPDSPRISNRFYTGIATDVDSGPAHLAEGSMTVAKSNGQSMIAQLSLPGVSALELRKGPGAQIAALMPSHGDGWSMIQVKASAPAGKSDVAWTWRQQAQALRLVDDKNQQYGPPSGVWATYADGESKKLVALYASGMTPDFGSIKPMGPLESVWFVFEVPNGTKIARLVLVPDTLVKAQPLNVP